MLLDQFVSTKWGVVLALSIFSVVLFMHSQKKQTCQIACVERGFSGFRYLSKGRYGAAPEKCYCLTLEETKVENKIPKGVLIKLIEEN